MIVFTISWLAGNVQDFLTSSWDTLTGLKKRIKWRVFLLTKTVPNFPIMYVSFCLFYFLQMTSPSLKSQCNQKPSLHSRAQMWHSSARQPAPVTRPWLLLGRRTTKSSTTQISTTRPICECGLVMGAKLRWLSIQPPCNFAMWSFTARESTSVSSPTTLDLLIQTRPGSPSTVS